MSHNKCVLTKDDANKALDNINMWITNCDTKTSIVLAFYVAIIALCFSTDFFDIQCDIFDFCFQDICCLKIVYFIVHLGSIITFVIGIIALLIVIIPKIIYKTEPTKEFKSVLFYASIAKHTPTYSEYLKSVRKVKDEKQLLNDILFQVHSAALICARKFCYQKIGLILTMVSSIVFFISTIIGLFII